MSVLVILAGQLGGIAAVDELLQVVAMPHHLPWLCLSQRSVLISCLPATLRTCCGNASTLSSAINGSMSRITIAITILVIVFFSKFLIFISE